MGKTIKKSARDSNHKEKDKKSKDKAKKKGARADKFYNTYEERQFQQHLQEINLQYIEMRGDGNCLFRSIAHQLGREPVDDNHMTVREEIMDYMEKNKDSFMMFIDVDDEEDITDDVFADYIERMKVFGEWGGQPELCAAAQCYQVNIVVHQWDAPKYIITGTDNSNARTIAVSFHGDCHYNSIVSLDPSTQTQPEIPACQDNDFLESVRRAVPWAKDKDIIIAKREVSIACNDDQQQNKTTQRAVKVDDVIDFLCSHMDAIRLGHFEDIHDTKQQDEHTECEKNVENLNINEDTSSFKNKPETSGEKDDEWQVCISKSKKRDKVKVLSKKEQRKLEKTQKANINSVIEKSSDGVSFQKLSSNQTSNMKEIVL